MLPTKLSDRLLLLQRILPLAIPAVAAMGLTRFVI